MYNKPINMMQGFTSTTEPTTASSKSVSSPVWCCGDTAQLHSLVAMKELNDAKCRVLSEMDNGRIMVELHSEGEDSKRLSVNVENLKHCTTAPVAKQPNVRSPPKYPKEVFLSTPQKTTPVVIPDSARKQTADFLRWRHSSVCLYRCMLYHSLNFY